MENTNENIKTEICIILLCISIILPLLLISIYNRPSADDYDYSILTHQVVENSGNFFGIIKAAWDTTVNFYNSWQGLYTSAFLLALQPGIFGTQYYAFTTLIVMIIAYLCLFGSIHILNKHFVKKSILFTATSSLVILTILMLWLPSPTQGLYWYNGAMNYMPFVFLTILNLSILFEANNTIDSHKGKILLTVSTILSFIISGGNHITAFANILFLIIAEVLCLKKGNLKNKCYTLLPLLAACIGFAIMYFAPGTKVRQDCFESQGVIKTIIATIRHVRFQISEFFSFPWILSLFVITPTALEIVQKNKEKFSKHFPFLAIACSVVIICAMYCVPYFAMGQFGAGRITNVIWITFIVLSWLIYILILGYLIANEYLNVEKILNSKFAETSKILTISVSLVMLFFLPNRGINSNSMKAMIEISDGTAYRYSVEMDERTKLYEDEKLTYVEVKPLRVKSELLFFDDIGPDPNVWPNTSISRYYKKIIYLLK